IRFFQELDLGHMRKILLESATLVFYLGHMASSASISRPIASIAFRASSTTMDFSRTAVRASSEPAVGAARQMAAWCAAFLSADLLARCSVGRVVANVQATDVGPIAHERRQRTTGIHGATMSLPFDFARKNAAKSDDKGQMNTSELIGVANGDNVQ